MPLDGSFTYGHGGLVGIRDPWFGEAACHSATILTLDSLPSPSPPKFFCSEFYDGIRLYYHVHLLVQFQSSATMSLRLPPVCLSVNQTYRHFYYETDVLEISPD